jgi:hypothetical protein
MNSELSDFVEIPFPAHGAIVYVLCFVGTGQKDPVPFYVGGILSSRRPIWRLRLRPVLGVD